MEDRYLRVFSAMDLIQQRQAYMPAMDLEHLNLYEAREVAGFAPGSLVYQAGQVQRPIDLNIARSVVDSVVASITMNNPFIMVTTEGGDWKRRQKAKGVTQFVDGAFEEDDAYAVFEDALTDCCVFGSGFPAVGWAFDKLVIERVFKPYILVDEMASLTCEPLCQYRSDFMSRDRAMELWPEHKDILREATVRTQAGVSHRSLAGGARELDVVELVSAYRMQTGPDPGLKVVCCDRGTLGQRAWRRDHPPWKHMRWAKPRFGWYGHGAVEEVESIQNEVVALLQKIQRSMSRLAKTWVFHNKANKIDIDHITNEECTNVPFEGASAGPIPLQVHMPSVISPETFAHLEWLKQEAYAIVGQSELSARQQLPAGMERASGAAIRNYDGITTRRFAPKEKMYEQAVVGVAELVMEEMRERHAGRADEDEGAITKYSVMYRNKGSLERLDWKSVELPSESIRVSAFPTSQLPKEPAGRMAMIQEWIGAGWVDPDSGFRLLGVPDTQREYDLRTAPLDHVHWLVDMMLYEGKEAPAPDTDIMDLQVYIPWVKAAYLYGQMHKAPEKNMDLLLQWYVTALNAAQAAAQAAMAEAQAAGAVPPGMGGPPPGAPMPGPEAPPEGAGGPPAGPALSAV